MMESVRWGHSEHWAWVCGSTGRTGDQGRVERLASVGGPSRTQV